MDREPESKCRLLQLTRDTPSIQDHLTIISAPDTYQYLAHPFGDTVADPLCTNCLSIRAPFELIHTFLCVMPGTLRRHPLLFALDLLSIFLSSPSPPVYFCSNGSFMVGLGLAGYLSHTPAGPHYFWELLLPPLPSSNQAGANLRLASRRRRNLFEMGA